MTSSAPRLPVLAALALFALAAPAGLVSDTIPAWLLDTGRANGGRLAVVSQKILPDQDSYARTGCAWVEAYLALAQATGDGCHMDSAKDILDHMLANRDDLRFAGQAPDVPYFYAPTSYLFDPKVAAPGWRHLSGDKTRAQVSVATDGRICELFLRWCEIARRSFPNYEADILRYLDRVHESIEMHQPSFREIAAAPASAGKPALLPAGGFHHWWHDNTFATTPDSPGPRVFSGQLPLSHSAIMARAMLAYDRLRGTTEYRDKVQRVVNQFLNALDPAYPGKAVWKFEPLNPARATLDDLDGGASAVLLVESAYRQGGFGVGAAHIRRLVATYQGCFDATTGSPSLGFDGAPLATAKPHELQRIRLGAIAPAWLRLSAYEPAILAPARRAQELHFANDTSGPAMAGRAALLYWEMVRDGAAILPDRAPAL